MFLLRIQNVQYVHVLYRKWKSNRILCKINGNPFFEAVKDEGKTLKLRRRRRREAKREEISFHPIFDSPEKWPWFRCQKFGKRSELRLQDLGFNIRIRIYPDNTVIRYKYWARIFFFRIPDYYSDISEKFV